VPDNRVYVPGDSLSAFLKSYLAFTRGCVTLDDPHADGDYNYPFGNEVSGIAVPNLTTTLAKAQANGATVLWGPYAGQGGASAMVRFPGGFITEIHDGTFH
jgi:hypothetical protein